MSRASIFFGHAFFLWLRCWNPVASKPQDALLQTTKSRICDFLLLGPTKRSKQKSHMWLPLWRHVCATVARADDPRHGFRFFLNESVACSHRFGNGGEICEQISPPFITLRSDRNGAKRIHYASLRFDWSEAATSIAAT